MNNDPSIRSTEANPYDGTVYPDVRAIEVVDSGPGAEAIAVRSAEKNLGGIALDLTPAVRDAKLEPQPGTRAAINQAAEKALAISSSSTR